MWVTPNLSYLIIITSVFGMVVTDVCKANRYQLRNRNKDNNLVIRLFAKVLAREMLRKSNSKLSLDDVLRNLPFLGYIQEGMKMIVCWG